MTKKDPYEVLGISRDATEGIAKKHYRKLAMQYHPDRNPGDKKAEIKFKEVAEAWGELKDILPKDPVPLNIPEGASEKDIEEIFVTWLLHPNNAVKKPASPVPSQQKETPESGVWTTVASESATGLVPRGAGPTGDWTKVRLQRGKVAIGLESITADEAAQLIYGRPNAFAALKWVQQYVDPSLCLYDALLAKAKDSSYKPPSTNPRSASTALIIRGTESVDRAACNEALRDPLLSVAAAIQKVAGIAPSLQFQGNPIQPAKLKLDLDWLVEHIKEIAKQCAKRGVYPSGGTDIVAR